MGEMKQLRAVKSLNGGIGVLHGQYLSLFREVGSAVWMAGPGAPLLGIAKYLGRSGWAAIGKDGRTFAKGEVKVHVWDVSRPATNGVATDGSNGANIILALSSFATSLPFFAQLSKTCGGKPTLVVGTCNNGAQKNKVWGFSNGSDGGDNDCYPTALREVIASFTGNDPGDIDDEFATATGSKGLNWSRYVAPSFLQQPKWLL